MFHFFQKTLSIIAYLCVGALVIAYLAKNRMPDATEIEPKLLADPIQAVFEATPFRIHFKGVDYEVQPRATYDIRGLVVSHNNPKGIADITHTDASLDTRDLCVIWGDNLRNNQFHKVKFWSGDWTCYCQWKDANIRFRMDQMSNNHMIAESDFIRDQIDDLGIGDQVHIRGLLADYREVGSGDRWRRSSLVRTDSGNGACEVVFVQELTVLRSETWIWRKVFRYAGFALLGTLLLKFSLFFFVDVETLRKKPLLPG